MPTSTLNPSATAPRDTGPQDRSPASTAARRLPAFRNLAHHSLPVPPARYVPTADVNAVRFALASTIRTGHISLIDGSRGVGKTTAIVEAIRLLTSARPVYVNLIDAGTPRDAMQQVWQALTGESTAPRATAYMIRDDLTRELRHLKVVLIIDDAHNLNVQAMRTLLSLWNRIHHDSGKGLPMVLVGNGLVERLSASIPELVSRVSGYDLMCRTGYGLTCRSRLGDYGMGSPPVTRLKRSLSR